MTKHTAGRRSAQSFAALGLVVLTGLFAMPAWAAEMDDDIFWSVRADEFELRGQSGKDAFAWEAEGWAGTDDHKIALTSEGERLDGGPTEKAEVQLLYRRLISDFFDLEVGARHDV
jgi:copper resistance protein B